MEEDHARTSDIAFGFFRDLLEPSRFSLLRKQARPRLVRSAAATAKARTVCLQAGAHGATAEALRYKSCHRDGFTRQATHGDRRHHHPLRGPGNGPLLAARPAGTVSAAAVRDGKPCAREFTSSFRVMHLQLGNAIVGAAEPPAKLAVDVLHHHHIAMDIGLVTRVQLLGREFVQHRRARRDHGG
jgi:hypothetical protein